MNTRNLSTKDLMVGDWVSLSKGNWSENRQVELIDIEMIAESVYFAAPITITQEILEKNGFENIGDDTYQLEEKPYWFWVDFFNHQYGCEYDTSTHEYEDDEHRLKLYGIPSVHELQHALRLCGIEKEIEL